MTELRVLFDTGALQGNYISKDTARKISESNKLGNTVSGIARHNKRQQVVCSPISEVCMTISDNIELAFNFESRKNIKTCSIEFNGLPSLSGSRYDIIDDEKLIIAQNLVSFYYNEFVKDSEHKGCEGSAQSALASH